MDSLSVYRQIYNDLLEKIVSGRYNAGDRLPSESDLSQAYGVSRITSKRALDLLADQGIIVRQSGKGSFVNGAYKNPADTAATRLIGFVLPDFSDSFGTRLIYSVEESCKAYGYQLVLRRTRDQSDEEEGAIKSLSGVAGILLLPVHGALYNPEVLKLIIDKRALVLVDRKMKGLGAPSISSNNMEAAEAGTRYLFQLGHRNIAFFSGPVNHTSTVEERQQGYLRAHAEFRTHPNPEYICQSFSSSWTGPYYSSKSVSMDVEAAIKYLKSHPEISAAFTSEYIIACMVKDAVEALGRKVPKDFSIVTFDSPPSVAEVPPFTHLFQDEYAMGKAAVQTLEGIISKNVPASAGEITVPARLIIGASTCAKDSGKTAKQSENKQ